MAVLIHREDTVLARKPTHKSVRVVFAVLGVLTSAGEQRGGRGLGWLLCTWDVGWVFRPEQDPVSYTSPGTGLAQSTPPQPRPSLLECRAPETEVRGKYMGLGDRVGVGAAGLASAWSGPSVVKEQPILVHPAWAPRPEAATLSPRWMGEANPLGTSLP